MEYTHAFVIDTNQYAGNFERPMCAFITGELGECEVGKEQQQVFDEEIGKRFFEDLIEQVADEHGCYRPAYIFPTPGRLNDGMGKCYDAKPNEKGYSAYESVAIFFQKKPSKKLIDLMKLRAEQYVARDWSKDFGPKKNSIKISGFRWVTRKESIDEEAV